MLILMYQVMYTYLSMAVQHNTSVYILYNIVTSSAGLQQLVDMYEPKFVFLQECTLDSLTLQAELKGGGLSSSK